jgi:hypothetical protein
MKLNLIIRYEVYHKQKVKNFLYRSEILKPNQLKWWENLYEPKRQQKFQQKNFENNNIKVIYGRYAFLKFDFVISSESIKFDVKASHSW